MGMAHDYKLGRLVRSQLGLCTRTQSDRIGIPPETLRNWARGGRLIRIRDGLFRDPAVAWSWNQDVLAAILSAPPGSGASHATAARLWRLESVPRDPVIHVATPTRTRAVIPGVCFHRAEYMRRGDIAKLGVIPVTSPGWTLVHVAGSVDEVVLEECVLEGVRRGIVTVDALRACLALVPNGHGTGAMRRLLTSFDPAEIRRLMSTLETQFYAFLRRYRLPLPRVNVVIDTQRLIAKVDARWEHARLVVEIDGLRFHATRAHKRYDDERQNALVLAGERVLRYDASALRSEQDRMAREIGQALVVEVRR